MTQNRFLHLLLISLLFVAIPISGVAAATINVKKGECVILLHGLARSASSMEDMELALSKRGYEVINVDYPSRDHTVEWLAEKQIPQALSQCRDKNTDKIHFVTHSMGGILVRYYLAKNIINQLGRVVMLSPPNQGSEVVDKLRDFPGYKWLNGPAGQQLGTGKDSLPLKLGKVDFDLGIITGSRSINLILSLLIPGDDDGKVSITRAKIEGMSDFLVVKHTHPLIMSSDDVIKQTIHFLMFGKFERH